MVWYTIFCLKTLIFDINFKGNYRHIFKKNSFNFWPYNDSYFCQGTISCIMSFDYYRGSSLKTIWSHNFNGHQSSQSQGSFVMHFGSCNKKNLKTDLFLIPLTSLVQSLPFFYSSCLLAFIWRQKIFAYLLTKLKLAFGPILETSKIWCFQFHFLSEFCLLWTIYCFDSSAAA